MASGSDQQLSLSLKISQERSEVYESGTNNHEFQRAVAVDSFGYTIFLYNDRPNKKLIINNSYLLKGIQFVNRSLSGIAFYKLSRKSHVIRIGDLRRLNFKAKVYDLTQPFYPFIEDTPKMAQYGSIKGVVTDVQRNNQQGMNFVTNITLRTSKDNIRAALWRSTATMIMTNGSCIEIWDCPFKYSDYYSQYIINVNFPYEIKMVESEPTTAVIIGIIDVGIRIVKMLSENGDEVDLDISDVKAFLPNKYDNIEDSLANIMPISIDFKILPGSDTKRLIAIKPHTPNSAMDNAVEDTCAEFMDDTIVTLIKQLLEEIDTDEENEALKIAIAESCSIVLH